MIKENSKWSSTDGKVFVVLRSVETQGNTWVFYKNEKPGTPQEYSCFREAFESRFRPLPE
jgi:hypothetical protein